MSWAHPIEISDVSLAFPADALDYMPSYEECKAGLANLTDDRRRKWETFASRWTFGRVPDTMQVLLRTSGGVAVDGPKAFRQLDAIRRSFAPKHEHKEAALAYLASLWFRDVSYEGFGS